MIRTLARFGVDTMGLRVMGSLELAGQALMRSGVSVAETYLSSAEEPSVIYSFLKDIPYFASASYADAQSLSMALSTMRGLTADDEDKNIETALASGEFPEKNEALLMVYRSYIGALKRDGRIDRIGLIRKAIEETRPFDAEFRFLRECPLTPLEKALLTHVSGGRYEETDLPALFGCKAAPVSGLSYMESYGEVNEAENILAGIYQKKLPLDSCLIASAAPASYAQLFLDLCSRYDIPLTFGSGVPISNAYPASLLKGFCAWDAAGFNGIDALKTILLSPAFSRDKLKELFGAETLKRSELEALAETAGSLRLGFDKNVNDSRLAACQASLERRLVRAKADGAAKEIRRLEEKLALLHQAALLASEFEKGICYCLETYAVIRPEPYGRIDRSALSVILSGLGAFLQYAPDKGLKEITEELLKKTVCSEPGREGALHICSLKDAKSCIRKHLYVCGLSAAQFPGNPTENYLLLDNDLAAFPEKDAAPTSAFRISRRKQELRDLLDLAASLGIEPELSYAGYGLSDLKDRNPSSVLFALYEETHPGASMEDFRNEFRHAEYFDSALSESRLAGEAYSRGCVVLPEEGEAPAEDREGLLERAWSPSALELFFQCPMRFYLTQILRLPEDEPDDPFEVIGPAPSGTLAHSLMEKLAAKDLGKEEFLALAGEAFNDFLTERPPLHTDAAARAKNDFLRMMDNAYSQESAIRNEVLSAEEKYIFKHESGITLCGYPDRVEKETDDRYIIADFKTKRKVDHVKDDIDTCLQVVIYAWLCEQAGLNVTRCDYRYIRKNRVITCRYDDGMKRQLGEKLTVFRQALEEGSFPRNPGKDNENCRYCRMADICMQAEDPVDTDGEVSDDSN